MRVRSRRHTTPMVAAGMGVAAFAIAMCMTDTSQGYDRWKMMDIDDNPVDGTNCSTCHGNFTDGTSPAGSTFPGDDKHQMHRSSQEMNTDCDLCHTAGDDRNPWLGSSDGTGSTPGLGCVGCHGRFYGAPFNDDKGVGLRLHHLNNNIFACVGCHSDDSLVTVEPENVAPRYYGSFDTNVFDPCNEGPLFGESWSTDDNFGLDNDGDNGATDGDDFYDTNDPDCGATPCLGDTNGDEVVDVTDLVAVILDWNTDGSSNGGDVDGSGLVDVSDLVDVIVAWGVCP